MHMLAHIKINYQVINDIPMMQPKITAVATNRDETITQIKGTRVGPPKLLDSGIIDTQIETVG